MRIAGNHDNYGKKIYPELPDSISNELLDEQWAEHIHSQTLKRLNERGGLCISELLMNLKRMTLKEYFNIYDKRKENQDDAKELLLLLNKKQEAQVSDTTRTS
jgi:hypothetical protein